MDLIDVKIINLLKENSRITSSDISKKINLSTPAVTERIRKMDEAGVIEKYTIKVNRALSDSSLMAFIFVNIDSTENIEGFRAAIVKFDCVLECHHLAGNYDYLLKVITQSTNTLEIFISNGLRKIKGVSLINTIIVLSTLKEEMNLSGDSL